MLGKMSEEDRERLGDEIESASKGQDLPDPLE